MPAPAYSPLFPLGDDLTKYRLLSGPARHISAEPFADTEILKIAPEALRVLARAAFREVSFFLRPEHNRQCAAILDDPSASDNDRAVALALLRNAEISAQGVLPLCQDTGTAIVVAKKGQQIWTGGDDTAWLSAGIAAAYAEENLRYSQTAALSMFEETNTGNNLPARIEIEAVPGSEYRFLFMAKGGGSANKTFLYQETKAVLNSSALKRFLTEKMKTLGTAACPPYHLAFVIGGTSAEATLKVVKLASAKYLDTLPTAGNQHGQAFRDLELERELLEEARRCGIGAQFGGRHFAHDVRVIRLPRHGASCPIGLGVSCAADRNLKAKIDRSGIWIEQLDHEPGRLIPAYLRGKKDEGAVRIDLSQGMVAVLAQLDKLPVAARVLLNGPVIVGRDIAHAKWKELLDQGRPLPDYLKRHPVYCAGPAKTPPGMASGSFGPTTAGRMDDYVDLLQKQGGSLVMIAKGNRSPQVTQACRENGGFYLGSIGGPAALLAQECIRRVECIDYAELGMEAVWRIEVEDFPAFVLVDNKGNDFFRQLKQLK
ncbi:MAG: fumarase, class I, homodimeric [Candidatus Electronema aureum]|uniref:Fumarate hydratase class I n=1 Tax=Candidatus Electronema aureum TaxID=2005002 RepID=A0A521G4L0_9BACT|nr:MAG: fumarase, class I, homodimeric [Candidatus Electronema aureum]